MIDWIVIQLNIININYEHNFSFSTRNKKNLRVVSLTVWIQSSN